MTAFQTDATRATVQGMFDARFMMPDCETVPHTIGPDHELRGVGACADAEAVLLQRFVDCAASLISIEVARFGDAGV